MCVGALTESLSFTGVDWKAGNGMVFMHFPCIFHAFFMHLQAVWDRQAVDEILVQAIQAGQEASNRAMKRRVRQRLHKKLGTMLSTVPRLALASLSAGQEDFDAAMHRFKMMEERESPVRFQRSKSRRMELTPGRQRPT